MDYNNGSCPYCGSSRLIKSGKAYFRDGMRQNFCCKDCHRRTTKPNKQLELIKGGQ